jgi:sugar (pentulose or hexulose) kinase
MSKDQLFLGIDSGTQGTKAIVFSREKGKIIAEAYADHRIIETNEGRREQDPGWWVEASTTVIGQVLMQSGVSKQLIRAIGVSGQQHGMVALDLNGDVIRPAKLWCDTETSQQCVEITKKIGSSKKVIELIGNSIAAGFTASKILWLKHYEPQNYARLAIVLLPHDYINFWLTGEMKTEFGDASGTAYFDVKTRTWSNVILDAIDDSGKLQDCLPNLVPSDTPIGTIRAEIAEQFQLNSDVLVSSGPVIDRNGELAAFCSSTGGWLPLVCTMNVTVSTELARELLGLSVSNLNNTASTAELGAGGIILLPYFNGERTPALPNAKAVLFGLTSTNYNPRNLARASMEGATLGLRYGLDVLKQLGIDPSEIRLVGGGAKSPLWRQMVADVFNCPVVCPESSEAGAVGAALQAMWCYICQKEGDVSITELTDQFIALDEATRAVPDASNASRYADIYQHYLQLNKTIRPMFSGE